MTTERPTTTNGPCRHCTKEGHDCGVGCDGCAGTGWERDLTCDSCGGDGWTEEFEIDEYGYVPRRGGGKQVMCPDCAGTGEVQATGPVDLVTQDHFWIGLSHSGLYGKADPGVLGTGWRVHGHDRFPVDPLETSSESEAVHLCATGRWPDE